MEQLQQQMQAQQQQIAELLRVVQSQSQTIQRLESVAAQTAAPTQATGELVRELVKAVRGAQQTSLVDNKGLGKPSVFNNTEESFRVWSHKTSNFVCSVHREAKDLLAACAQDDTAVDLDVLKAQHFETPESLVDEINARVYQCLMALTDGESFDIVLGAGEGNGLEAWRRLQRRWDPSTVGRAKGLLREIMNPGKAKLADLQGSLERLEDMIRRYCSSRDSMGNPRTIAEDIRMSSLESLCPDDLEKHLQMNSARLTTYQQMRNEILLYVESSRKSGKLTKASQGYHPVPGGGPEPMDVGTFTKKDKGKGKGRGDGQPQGGGNPNKEKTCHHCGRKGHIKKDCWFKDTPKEKLQQPAAKAGAKPKGKGKGKGKSANEAEAYEEPVFEQSFGFGSLLEFNSVRVGHEVDKEGWIRCLLDSGASRTVFPADADYGVKEKADQKFTFKCANGENMESGDAFKMLGYDEFGNGLSVKGLLVDGVTKPLVAPGQLTERGHDVWMSGDSGCIVKQGTKLHKELRTAVDRILNKHRWAGTLPLYVENGTYRFYLKGAEAAPKQKADMCPQEEVTPSSSSGGRRRGNRP